MDIIVFDIETKETFEEVGGHFPERLSPSVVGLYSFNENRLLCFAEDEFTQMWPYFERAELVIGFNSNGFDLPILAKYYPPIKEIQSLDLLEEIKNSAGFRVKLDSVAEATLSKKKSGHGLEAIKMWHEGRIEELKKYCLDDVALTRDVYLYGKEKGQVLVTSFSGPQTIKVNFNPVIKARSTATLTLGL